MPDITMCKNLNCEVRSKCYRYMATPSIQQSYFFGNLTNKKCENYMSVRYSSSAKMVEVKYRPAKFEDYLILYRWRNDPITRDNGVNTEKIKLNEHKKWFKRCLLSIDTKIFIVEVNNKPIGTIRVVIYDGYEIISWTVAPKERSLGYGKLMVKNFVDKSNGKFIACIKENNINSKSIALNAGFKMFKKVNNLEYWQRKAYK